MTIDYLGIEVMKLKAIIHWSYGTLHALALYSHYSRLAIKGSCGGHTCMKMLIMRHGLAT